MVITGGVSRESTSFDKDLTRLRNGLEEERAVDLQGEEELELLKGAWVGRSDGQEELAGGVKLGWEWAETGLTVIAREGVHGFESNG